MTSSVAPARRILGESKNFPSNGQTPTLTTLQLDKGKNKEVVRTAEIISLSKSDHGVNKRTLPQSSTMMNLRGEGGRAVSRAGGERGDTKPRQNESRSGSPISYTQKTGVIMSDEIDSTASTINPTRPPKSAFRIVSEPPPTSRQIPTAIPAAVSSSTSSSLRSVSAQPHIRSHRREITEGDRPASRAGPSALSPVFDEAIVEEEEPVSKGDLTGESGVEDEAMEEEEDIVYLKWAIEGGPSENGRGVVKAIPVTGSFGLDEEVRYLRKEMMRMQIDMLRMNRDMKVSIRHAELVLM